MLEKHVLEGVFKKRWFTPDGVGNGFYLDQNILFSVFIFFIKKNDIYFRDDLSLRETRGLGFFDRFETNQKDLFLFLERSLFCFGKDVL